MIDIVDTPPELGHATDRDRVSLLEIVGSAALFSVTVWSITSLITPVPGEHLLTTIGLWVAISTAWSSVIAVTLRERIDFVVSVFGAATLGALIPLVFALARLSARPDAFVEAMPTALTVAIIAVCTMLAVRLPRRARGIIAVLGFLGVLVFYTVAFGQVFIDALRMN